MTVYFLFLQPKDEKNLLHLYERILRNDNDYNKKDLNSLLKSSWPRQDAIIVSYPASSYIAVIEEAIDHAKKKLEDEQKNNRRQLEENDFVTTGENKRVKLSVPRFDETEAESSTYATDETTTFTATSTSENTESSSKEKSDEDLSTKGSITSRLSDLGYIENEASKYLK